MPLCWIELVLKNLYSRGNLITKYRIVFLGEKFFGFILAISKETYFSILVEKIHTFSLEPKSSFCFLDKLQSRTGVRGGAIVLDTVLQVGRPRVRLL